VALSGNTAAVVSGSAAVTPSESNGSASAPQKPLPWEFNGVVRLTRIGTVYVLSTVVLAIAAINTGNNALYIAVAFMLGCLLLSGIASKGGLKNLEVEVPVIREVWACKPADGILRLRNRSRIWNVRDIVITAESLAVPLLIPVVSRGETRTIPVQFVFPRRGRAQLSTIDSYTRYPFGFFLKKRRLRVQSEVVVYPLLLPDGSETSRFRRLVGDEQTTVRRGLGSEVHSFRDYSRGDSLRHVHWKKSASLGRWIIKQPATDVQASVHVIIDPYSPHGVSDEEFEEMVSSAATLIFEAVRKGYDVTLSLPRISVRARPAEPAAPLFLALALLEPARERVHQVVDRGSILFSVWGGRDDAKSA
jgi:uncharacterized protein (DUF58 family)